MQAAPQAPPQGETISQLIEQVTAALAAAGVGTPRLDAELLLAAASGSDRTTLYARGRDRAASQWMGALQAMLTRRLAREPLQYIVGMQEFWSLEFAVTPDVLIPRPETELLVELTLQILGAGSVHEPSPLPRGTPGQLNLPRRRPGMNSRAETLKSPLKGTRRPPFAVGFSRLGATQPGNSFPGERDAKDLSGFSTIPTQDVVSLCDMGTGSGCIAVALARELPQADIWAIDASPAALTVAQANARRHGVARRIRFAEGDMFERLVGQRFDAIVSNPPYLTAAEMAALQPEVRWEPRRALDGGAAGLDIIARLLAAAPAHLVDGGSVIMEIGAGQEAAVRSLAAAHFHDVSVCRDYAGHPRALLATRRTWKTTATQRGADHRMTPTAGPSSTVTPWARS